MSDDVQVTYDTEITVNGFLCSAQIHRRPETMTTWEWSFRRDDRYYFFQWLRWLYDGQIPMIGFNNLGYDYILMHHLFKNPDAPFAALYDINQRIFASQNRGDRFNEFNIWESDRFAPQWDLFKIHHFDNQAKSTSLKALECNMRSASVRDLPFEPGEPWTAEALDQYIIPYNRHDVSETDRFAVISSENIKFRRELISSGMLDGDVLNFNDTKIGKQLFEQRLGPEQCYTRVNGRKQPRQTFRTAIYGRDIVFPYIRFEHPEFQRILDYFRNCTITETKGAFEDLSATINGFTFHFGTGGIHGSVASRKIVADDEYAIVDLDVAAYYPSIGIVNRLHPAHLDQDLFCGTWNGIKQERKKYAKGTSQNGGFKLAGNGPYGDSNNVYSPLYDPQFTMTITVNGQLMLCMLAEQAMKIPTCELIQINTDGLTVRIRRDYLPYLKAVTDWWQNSTMLELEEARYARMFIRDVNNYVAEPDDPKKAPKLKGAYWYPVKFPEDISNASPSAWYKDLGGPIIQRAADAYMLRGVLPEHTIWAWHDPFDFMLFAKVKRGTQLYIGDRPVQRITRYYMARNGAPMRKVSPPVAGAVPGSFKRNRKASDAEYYAILQELRAAGTPDAWDARIHTANKSKHDDREMAIQAGYHVAECNLASDFDWANLNRDWYIEQARKLIIN
jgi:hypothetical protein